MKDLNLSNVQEATEFKKICPGGYICKITAVEDVPEKEYLKIEYDIVEGEFAGYWKKLYDNKAFWGGRFVRSYKEKALSFFKSFTTAVERSNSGYKFDNDETKLQGKLVGLVLAEEEYTKNDGATGIRVYVDKARSVEEIQKGNYTIPPLRSVVRATGTTANGPYPIDENASDDDMAF